MICMVSKNNLIILDQNSYESIGYVSIFVEFSFCLNSQGKQY